MKISEVINESWYDELDKIRRAGKAAQWVNGGAAKWNAAEQQRLSQARLAQAVEKISKLPDAQLKKMWDQSQQADATPDPFAPQVEAELLKRGVITPAQAKHQPEQPTQPVDYNIPTYQRQQQAQQNQQTSVDKSWVGQNTDIPAYQRKQQAQQKAQNIPPSEQVAQNQQNQGTI